MMIRRTLGALVVESLRHFPVVGLIGARQVGKTTLAKAIASEHSRDVVYLDLERPSDLAKLEEAELYLEQHQERLVILDEIQRRPELLPVLRALVDTRRLNGRFLILGSASPSLLRQSSETLAGRIRYLELPPLTVQEIDRDPERNRRLWVRGGYPLSYLAESDELSLTWRSSFIQTHLERDLPNFGVRVAATTLRRFWQMIAHSHGQLWNASKLAASLGVSMPTARHYLDILQDTFMVRQLQPYHGNIKKRLIKSPKVYLRDSGILHALLGVQTYDQLLGHPSAGSSWEGWVIEQLIAMAPDWGHFFYRTGAGAEIDLVLLPPGRMRPVAVEIKHSLDPRPGRGFWFAHADLRPSRSYVVYPGAEAYPLGKELQALPVDELERVTE